MRDYGKVHTRFWRNPETKRLAAPVQRAALYLLTCEHGNAAGVFHLPLFYAAEDLQEDPETVRERFRNLSESRFIAFDDDYQFVWIRNYLAFNAFENPNVAKSALKALMDLPPVAWRDECLRSLLELGRWNGTDGEAVITRLLEGERALPKPFRKGFETVREPFRKPEPEPEPEPIPEPERDSALTSRVMSRNDAPTEGTRNGSARGHRLPPDWEPSAADIEFARSERFGDRDIDRMAATFRDYWCARSGAGATKTDWHRTWCNWVRREADSRRGGTRRAASNRGAEDVLAAVGDLVSQTGRDRSFEP